MRGPYFSPWIAGGSSGGGGGGGISPAIDITVAAAQARQDAGTLIKGQYYRIVDAMASTWAILVIADAADKMGTVGEGIFGGIAGTLHCEVTYDLGDNLGDTDMLTKVWDADNENYVEGYNAILIFDWNNASWNKNRIEAGGIIDLNGATVGGQVTGNIVQGLGSSITANGSTVITAGIEQNTVTGGSILNLSDATINYCINNTVSNASLLTIDGNNPGLTVNGNIVSDGSNLLTDSLTLISNILGTPSIEYNEVRQFSLLDLSGATIDSSDVPGGTVGYNIVISGSTLTVAGCVTCYQVLKNEISNSTVSFDGATIGLGTGILNNTISSSQVSFSNITTGDFISNDLSNSQVASNTSTDISSGLATNNLNGATLSILGKIGAFDYNLLSPGSSIVIEDSPTRLSSISFNILHPRAQFTRRAGADVTGEVTSNVLGGPGNVASSISTLDIRKNVTGDITLNTIMNGYLLPGICSGSISNNEISDGSGINFAGSAAHMVAITKNTLTGGSVILGNATTSVQNISGNSLSGNSTLTLTNSVLSGDVSSNTVTDGSTFNLTGAHTTGAVQKNNISGDSTLSVLTTGVTTVQENTLSGGSVLSTTAGSTITGSIDGNTLIGQASTGQANTIILNGATIVDCNKNNLTGGSKIDATNANMGGSISGNLMSSGSIATLHTGIDSFLRNSFSEGSTLTSDNTTNVSAVTDNVVSGGSVLTLPGFTCVNFQVNLISSSTLTLTGITCSGAMSLNQIANATIQNTSASTFGQFLSNQIFNSQIILDHITCGNFIDNVCSGGAVVTIANGAMLEMVGNEFETNAAVTITDTTITGVLSNNKFHTAAFLNLTDSSTIGGQFEFNNFGSDASITMTRLTLGGDFKNNTISDEGTFDCDTVQIDGNISSNTIIQQGTIQGDNYTIHEIEKNMVAAGFLNLSGSIMATSGVIGNIIDSESTVQCANSTMDNGVRNNVFTTRVTVQLSNLVVDSVRYNHFSRHCTIDFGQCNISLNPLRHNVIDNCDANFHGGTFVSFQDNRFVNSSITAPNVTANYFDHNVFDQDCLVDITGFNSTDDFIYNIFRASSSLTMIGVHIGQFAFNEAYTNVDITLGNSATYQGIFSNNVIKNGSTIDVDNDTLFSNCFLETFAPATLSDGTHYDGNTYIFKSYSNFERQLDLSDPAIFAAGVLTIPTGDRFYVGIFRCVNIPAGCTVNSFVANTFQTPFVFYGDTSGTITWGITPLPLSYTQITASADSYACFDYISKNILAWLNY